MSFNVEVTAKPLSVSGVERSLYQEPTLVITGNFKLRSITELRAFIEIVAKAAVVFDGKITDAQLQELLALGKAAK